VSINVDSTIRRWVAEAIEEDPRDWGRLYWSVRLDQDSIWIKGVFWIYMPDGQQIAARPAISVDPFPTEESIHQHVREVLDVIASRRDEYLSPMVLLGDALVLLGSRE
jgi:hypothetical protein